jgi:hypothetical protein
LKYYDNDINSIFIRGFLYSSVIKNTTSILKKQRPEKTQKPEKQKDAGFIDGGKAFIGT